MISWPSHHGKYKKKIKKKCMNSTPQSVKICYENDSKQQVNFNGKKKSSKFSKDQCCESTNREHTVLGKEEPEETAKH